MYSGISSLVVAYGQMGHGCNREVAGSANVGLSQLPMHAAQNGSRMFHTHVVYAQYIEYWSPWQHKTIACIWEQTVVNWNRLVTCLQEEHTCGVLVFLVYPYWTLYCVCTCMLCSTMYMYVVVCVTCKGRNHSCVCLFSVHVRVWLWN